VIVNYQDPQKGTSLPETASYEPSFVEIGSAFFAVGDKNEQESRTDVRVTHDSSACMKAPTVKI